MCLSFLYCKRITLYLAKYAKSGYNTLEKLGKEQSLFNSNRRRRVFSLTDREKRVTCHFFILPPFAVSIEFYHSMSISNAMAFSAPPLRPTNGHFWTASLSSVCHITACGYSPAMKSKRRRSKPTFPPTPKNPKKQSHSAAPRINMDDSTLSLREQLKLAKLNADLRQSDAPQRPVVRTKFRRKKEAGMRSGARVAEEDTVLPDGKYAIQLEPILYIDAYNVIGAWPRLRKWRDRGDMSTARRLLIHDVAEYSYVRAWQCVVVFDAQGTEAGVKQDITPQNVEVVFTGSETADSYIERCIHEVVEGGKRQVWAATSDRAQLAFSIGKGAHIMSSSLFIQEIKRARKETMEKVSEPDEGKARGKMLIATVNQKTRDRLYELRDKLG